jgi:uncharacterized protein
MPEAIRQKIVIFGAFGAGKTTLIKTIDPNSTHIEANCAGGTTTIALDFGRVDLDGRQLHIYGTPGQERFEFAREIIAKGMDGAILLVDASSPVDEFTRHLFTSLTAAKVPFVIFLNKCDGKGSVPEALAGEFGTTPIWIVSALDRKPCLDALCRFAGTLPAHMNGSSGQR